VQSATGSALTANLNGHMAPDSSNSHHPGSPLGLATFMISLRSQIYMGLGGRAWLHLILDGSASVDP